MAIEFELYDAAEFLTDTETADAYLGEALACGDPRAIAKAKDAILRAQLAQDSEEKPREPLNNNRISTARRSLRG